MNYGEIRDASLKLIGQYTIAGTLYPASYNNQQDYLNKIPFLVNDCLISIAKTVRKLPAQITLDPAEGEVYGDYLRFPLPEDLLSIRSGGVLMPDPDRRRDESHIWTRYIMQEPDYILFPKGLDRPVILTYYRRPQLLPFSEMPADDTRIDASLDVQMAIPYYVAAHLVLEDDSFRYASLMNEYNAKLADLTPAPYTEITTVHDAYSDDDDWRGGFYG